MRYLLLIVLLAFMAPAYGHDPEHPELDGWYMQLHSKRGSPCCDGSDAKHLADPEWDSKDGHYRVQIDGKWINVPDDAVIDGPNKDGRALVWPYYLNGELTGIRCFLPGSGA